MLHELRKLKDVWNKFQFILTKSQKKYGCVILLMTLLGALVETLGVSVIIPFVQAMMDADQLMQNKYMIVIMEILGIHTASQVLMTLGIGIALIYILKNAYLTLLSYCRIKFATKVQRELSTTMMKSYMDRGYLFFSRVNTSELLRGVINDVNAVYQIMYNMFRAIAELLTALAIVIYIMMTDIMMAVCVIVLAGICFLAIVMGFRKPMKRLGREYRENNKEVQKHTLQAFQGIKEVIVMHRQNFFVDRYEKAYVKQQRAVIGQTVATESPAYVIEAVCVAGLFMAVTVRMSNGSDAATFIPQLASFAIAAFRILPSMGRITSSFNQIVYFLPSLNKTYENLKEVNEAEAQRRQEVELLKQENRQKVETKQTESPAYLSVEDIQWRYSADGKWVLNHINLEIQQGESVALIGQSGAGKTTLADIILGLYRPQSGCIKFNGVDIRTIPDEWCAQVGYIPQSVYLTDDTIRNNVAFGIDKPDDNMVWKALEQAQLKEFVKGLPNKLDTIVGDRGVRFSGGQRQRVAIARALYYNPSILILDEATSALDTETETAVMEAISSLRGNKTLIIVAHRLTTIRNCDEIYEIADGQAIKKIKKDVFTDVELTR